MSTRRGVLLVLLGVAAVSVHLRAQAPDEYAFRTLASIQPEGTAQFNFAEGVAVGADGTVYIADTRNHTIRKVTQAGDVTTLAGLAGTSGSADGAGTAARFSFPTGTAVDSAGTVYVADTGNSTIRKITPLGTVTTLAGAALGAGPTYVNGTGTEARFASPSGIAVDGTGTVYVADFFNCAIRKVTSAGVVSTLAGPAASPSSSQCRDGLVSNSGFVDGIGTAARFSVGLRGVAVDAAGSVYVADSYNFKIRKITQAGAVSTISAFGIWSWIAVDGTGTIYATRSFIDHDVHKIGPDGSDTLLAGGWEPGSVDGIGSAAKFWGPYGIGVDPAGTLYVADGTAIRKITAGAVVTTLAGNIVTSALPRGITIDSDQLVTVAATNHHTLLRITSRGAVTTIKGTTLVSGSDDDYTGGSIWAGDLGGIALDSAGNLYAAARAVIQKVAPNGGISTLAGAMGQVGSEDGTGAAARFRGALDVAVDAAGNVYVADEYNYNIRKITPAGMVTTVAGLAGTSGSTDGTGLAARFVGPRAIAVDSAGNLYHYFVTFVVVGFAGSCRACGAAADCGSRTRSP